jgi:hypothetical protein
VESQPTPLEQELFGNKAYEITQTPAHIEHCQEYRRVYNESRFSRKGQEINWCNATGSKADCGGVNIHCPVIDLFVARKRVERNGR